MFENAKNMEASPIKPECRLSDEIDSVTNIDSISQVIEKPSLPKRQFEDTDGVQQPMTGMLYDYQHLASPLW